MKIATIVGARPQFIKAAAVSRVLRNEPDVDECLIHTGQHYDHAMSDVFFDELDICKPDFNLSIGSGPHGAQTGRMLERIEQVFVEQSPDWVVVYGDTNSTLAGALAAAKLHIPVAHVEAGLRSFNRTMPEEVNRVLTDHVSDLLFAPTQTAAAHLGREGIDAARVIVCGDVMFDVCQYYLARADAAAQPIKQHDLTPGSYVLATVHRAENTDSAERLRVIASVLAQLARESPVVAPLHPRTRKASEHLDLFDELSGKVKLIEPVGYLDMVALEKHARLIVTDSGGVQKEAYFAGVPCVTLRDETEWTELVAAGWNRLAPPLTAKQVLKVVTDALAAGPPANRDRLYGDGDAAGRIVAELCPRDGKAACAAPAA